MTHFFYKELICGGSSSRTWTTKIWHVTNFLSESDLTTLASLVPFHSYQRFQNKKTEKIAIIFFHWKFDWKIFSRIFGSVSISRALSARGCYSRPNTRKAMWPCRWTWPVAVLNTTFPFLKFDAAYFWSSDVLIRTRALRRLSEDYRQRILNEWEMAAFWQKIL